MTSNPKKPVTIVLPDQRGQLILRPARVFVGDVELPVKSVDVDVDVDLDNGDVDLTLSTEEVRIVREAPAPAEPEPEPAKPGTKEYTFKADPRTVVLSGERESSSPFARMRNEITFTSAAPGDDEAATVSVTLPTLKPGTSPTGCKCSACDPRGAR